MLISPPFCYWLQGKEKTWTKMAAVLKDGTSMCHLRPIPPLLRICQCKSFSTHTGVYFCKHHSSGCSFCLEGGKPGKGTACRLLLDRSFGCISASGVIDPYYYTQKQKLWQNYLLSADSNMFLFTNKWKSEPINPYLFIFLEYWIWVNTVKTQIQGVISLKSSSLFFLLAPLFLMEIELIKKS